MDNILKKDWLISPPLDYEMKYYSLMGGLKSINEIIKNNQLYSAILKVESALHELYDIKYNRDIIEENNKVLIGIDTDNMSLDYEYKIEDDEIVKMYDLCNTAISELESIYKEIRVKWRALEKKCNISEIPDSKPTYTSGYIMYTDSDSDQIIIYKYKEPTSFSINWDSFKLIEIKRIENKIRNIAEFIAKDEELGHRNRFFRFSCNETAKYKESIFPIMQYMLFNRIKHGI